METMLPKGLYFLYRLNTAAASPPDVPGETYDTAKSKDQDQEAFLVVVLLPELQTSQDSCQSDPH